MFCRGVDRWMNTGVCLISLMNRYPAQALPSLNFDDGWFDLTLCSHLLFLYSDQLPFEFHRDSKKGGNRMMKIRRESD